MRTGQGGVGVLGTREGCETAREGRAGLLALVKSRVAYLRGQFSRDEFFCSSEYRGGGGTLTASRNHRGGLETKGKVRKLLLQRRRDGCSRELSFVGGHISGGEWLACLLFIG